MATAAAIAARRSRSRGWSSSTRALSGACRRAEGFLAQVLQRRRNHETFKLYRVAQEERPDLIERFEITTLPTLVVVEGKLVRAKLERPRGCREIEAFLAALAELSVEVGGRRDPRAATSVTTTIPSSCERELGELVPVLLRSPSPSSPRPRG